MQESLLGADRFRSYAPERARAPRKPIVAGVRYAGGLCSAACMYALGDECDCPCMGRNHKAGFRCDGVTAPSQESLF
jgi:hypothetical protein